MKTFEAYLIAKKLRESTVRGHLQDVRRFEKWSVKENISSREASYEDLLKFIREMRARGVSRSSVNIHLCSIEKYFDCLTLSGERNNNAARGLRIRNLRKKVLHHLLSTEQMEHLYQHYIRRAEWTFKGINCKDYHERRAIMLGLMIFQAADTPTLKKMEKTHIHLQKGTVCLPGTGRSNGRVLKLHPLQIIPLQNYLNTFSFSSEKLFGCHVTSVVFWLMKTLKKNHSQFKNLSQIRSSVIINWLRQYNIRQVQYMAGHKHISSTERYKQEDIQNLQDQVNQFHPLR